MKLVLSPAKSLNFEKELPTNKTIKHQQQQESPNTKMLSRQNNFKNLTYVRFRFKRDISNKAGKEIIDQAIQNGKNQEPLIFNKFDRSCYIYDFKPKQYNKYEDKRYNQPTILLYFIDNNYAKKFYQQCCKLNLFSKDMVHIVSPTISGKQVNLKCI